MSEVLLGTISMDKLSHHTPQEWSQLLQERVVQEEMEEMEVQEQRALSVVLVQLEVVEVPEVHPMEAD